MLWRRETRKIGTGETYIESASPDSVRVQSVSGNLWVETLLYTDFPQPGKIPNPTAAELADHAIRSVETAHSGMDGISYLIDAIHHSIQTPITSAYRQEILRRTKVDSLNDALAVARTRAITKT